jgi:hypothetical protein
VLIAFADVIEFFRCRVGMVTLKLGKIVMAGKDFSAGAGMVPPIFIVVGGKADCAAHPHSDRARHGGPRSRYLQCGEQAAPRVPRTFRQTFGSGGWVASRGFWSDARRRAASYHRAALFTGVSGSCAEKPGYAHFAAAKASLRMISQSMAREYGPQGIHVAHGVIDGGINGERLRAHSPTRRRRG